MGARNVFLNMKGPTRNFILAKRGGRGHEILIVKITKMKNVRGISL